MQVDTRTPINWTIDHLQIVGWPAVCVVVYKLARFLDKMQNRAAVVEDNISTLTENHFPHIQKSLESIDETMQRQETRWEAWLTAQAAHNRKD